MILLGDIRPYCTIIIFSSADAELYTSAFENSFINFEVGDVETILFINNRVFGDLE